MSAPATPTAISVKLAGSGTGVAVGPAIAPLTGARTASAVKASVRAFMVPPCVVDVEAGLLLVTEPRRDERTGDADGHQSQACRFRHGGWRHASHRRIDRRENGQRRQSDK